MFELRNEFDVMKLYFSVWPETPLQTNVVEGHIRLNVLQYLYNLNRRDLEILTIMINMV